MVRKHKYMASELDINVTVFSKDRACQLDLLLNSIQRNAEALWPPTIIYKCSDKKYKIAYEQLMTEGDNDSCNWVEERNIKEDVLDWVYPLFSYTMFLVDDDVFYQSLPEIPKLEQYEAYALRLGLNLTYCYNVDKPQKKGELDWDCKMSIDGHIYRTEDILPELKALEFNHVGQIEEKLYQRFTHYKLITPVHSVLVGIPHNRVSHYPNRHMGGSTEELNDRFLRGERIDFDKMDFSNVISVHQDIPYAFR